MNSARPLFNGFKECNVKYVCDYMVCIHIYKSVSRKENIFVHYESQNCTKQTLNQVLHVPHTYSIQTVRYITYSSARLIYTFPVNIRRCKSFVTLKYRLKAPILSK